MKKPIYLDYASSTPVDFEVVESMEPYLEKYFGNPSCSHLFGIETKNPIEHARKQVAELLGCQLDEIVFTGGVTESNNHAIKGTAFAYQNKGKHIISTTIEHPSITVCCKFLELFGFTTTYIPVDKYGVVDVKQLEKSITDQTILVSVMHVNNQIGTIQPLDEISRITRKYGIILHSDATQSVGKVALNVKMPEIDIVSTSGHKSYAPKGVGALYIRNGVQIENLIHGSKQEKGRRAGTENVQGIVGLGKAYEIAGRDWEKNVSNMKEMKELLYKELKRNFKEIHINGHLEKSSPDILNVSFKGMTSGELYNKMKDFVAVTPDTSYVLDAINLPEEWKKCAIRFSVGKRTTKNEIIETVSIIKKILDSAS
jgi:cysteine desulfurase